MRIGGCLGGGITTKGEVHLILADGAKLTANGTAADSNHTHPGIEVSVGNTLVIYGQTAGTGVLNATGAWESSNTKGSAGIGTGAE